MSKVATYLRGHLSGEVSVRTDIREAMSTDRGILRIKPEIVIFPRSTNDIRKVTRFAWQLAEKGHVLPVTVRGAGTDTTGASIGRGVSLVTTAHMNRLFEYDTKQKLVRLQPGVTVGALNEALGLHGAAIMPFLGSHEIGTVGGAIASAVTGLYAGKYGTLDGVVEQLEVVLANGDVMQTGRISKRELSRRKGVPGLEGDIYRGIDGLIDENTELLDTLKANDATGYNTIADVKQKDGSFDLTPLFVGAQGTLGIVSELILKSEFRSLHNDAAILVFDDANAARDALDDLVRLSPAVIEYFDASLFEQAGTHGKVYEWYARAKGTITPASVIITTFDEFTDRQRAKHLKKITKQFGAIEGVVVTTAEGSAADDMLAALDVTYYACLPDKTEHTSPAIFSGFHVPTARLEDFATALKALGHKHHIDLPLSGHVVTNTYSIHPTFELKKVGDKQKIFKLLDELTKLVYAHSGTMVAEGGEGRLKPNFIYSELDEKLVQLYKDIRSVCDPHGILNPGVKEVTDVRQLAEQLHDDSTHGDYARFGLIS
jgi:FAD/FMN-containing dehydrogenase